MRFLPFLCPACALPGLDSDLLNDLMHGVITFVTGKYGGSEREQIELGLNVASLTGARPGRIVRHISE